MSGLAGQVAIITGGALGIGGATARRLAEEGASVLIADINPEAAEANAERIRRAGGTADVIEADVGRHEDIKAFVRKAVELWGRLDILVNNARRPGAGHGGSALEVDEELWDRDFAELLKAIFLGAKYAIPEMVKVGKGSIVNISSVHGVLASPGRLVYDTAKTAVIGITRQLAVEFGPRGIRVNAVCPGLIVTERLRPLFEEEPGRRRFVEQTYPLRRHGWPVDIANAVAFLCSDEASFITGHALVVDGGLTIQLQGDLSNHIARFVREHPEVDVPWLPPGLDRSL